ncbi:MAG TPA: hypothetical protein VFL55_24575 [Acetobacteraceae bacterium]|nr:hypothetical protein [Acetobacteraceae bacterium]
MRSAAFVLLCLAWAMPALAEQPLLRPNRDVDVTYRSATPQGTLEQRVRWLAAAQTMRIDPAPSGLHVIIDYLARRMSVVRDATRSVVEMTAPDGMAGLAGAGTTMSFVRRGEATVAGEHCTEWQTQDRDSHPALVCVTSDGVLLRAGSEGQVRVSAVSVHYAPQDPGAFRVPSDYARQTPGAAR